MADAVTTVGRYELVRRLAGGGMGEVFAARMLGAEGFVKDVALKRIYPHLAGSQKHRQLFVREAKLVAQLTHPNIVQVIELGTDGDDLFMAMEFVSGVTLASLLLRFTNEGRRLPFQVVVTVANDLLEALSYAHEYSDSSLGIRGIIHADVSPQNVMINHQGRAKLCDFGVAKLLRSANQEATQRERWGKLAYMAPESIRDNTLDARADIYAVGIMMFEAISGNRAFTANNAADLSKAVLHGDRPSFYDVANDTPIEVSAVVERACSVNPDDRFHSATAMRRALLEAAGTESIEDSRQWLVDLVADFTGNLTRDGVGTAGPNGATPPTMITDAPKRTWSRAAMGALAGGLFAIAIMAAGYIWFQPPPQPTGPGTDPPLVERQPPEDLPEPALEDAAEAAPVGDDATGEGKRKRDATQRRASKSVVKSAKPALLTLNSVPWAYVILDGQRLPKPTPLFDYPLEPGPHTIQLRAANGKTQSLSLNLQPGQVVRRVVNLE